MLYFSRESSFVLPQILFLTLDGCFDVLYNNFLPIPLSYYYVNLRSSIICCLFSVHIFFLGISLSAPLFYVSLSTVSEIICCEFLDNFSVILRPIKSPLSSAIFRIAVFEAVAITFYKNSASRLK